MELCALLSGSNQRGRFSRGFFLETILVTGGAGFIGSHSVDLLVESGFKVSVVDNLSTGRKENLNPKAGFFQADITDLPALKKAFEEARPNFVLHQAAQISLANSFKDPGFDASSNILGSINVLECCRLFDVRKAVLASSCAVYGSPERLPVPESQPAKPASPYAVSKLAAEHYFFHYGKIPGLDCVVLRYGNVFGPRQSLGSETGVVSIFLQKMLEGKQATINGDGTQTRDFVFVEDIARANLLALQKSTKSKALNIAGGNKTSVSQVFSELKQDTGFKQEPIYGPAISNEVGHICLDIALAEKELGWKPAFSLRHGLKKTAAFARQS